MVCRQLPSKHRPLLLPTGGHHVDESCWGKPSNLLQPVQISLADRTDHSLTSLSITKSVHLMPNIFQIHLESKELIIQKITLMTKISISLVKSQLMMLFLGPIHHCLLCHNIILILHCLYVPTIFMHACDLLINLAKPLFRS